MYCPQVSRLQVGYGDEANSGVGVPRVPSPGPARVDQSVQLAEIGVERLERGSGPVECGASDGRDEGVFPDDSRASRWRRGSVISDEISATETVGELTDEFQVAISSPRASLFTCM